MVSKDNSFLFVYYSTIFSYYQLFCRFLSVGNVWYNSKKGVICMDDLTLVSHLSEEEIIENFRDVDFFSAIMEGLEDALSYKKGINMDSNM